MRNNSTFARGFLLAAAMILAAPTLISAQTAVVQRRITEAIDEAKLTPLRGNTHPLARPEFGRGLAPLSLPMERMLLVLKRGADQEAALGALLEQQQDQSSANYHQWLTPEQFGQQFGPSDADIQTVTSWLQSHGFQVARVSKGRTVIEFTGTAGQVREAFHTEIHKFVVNGEEHWANAGDPQIPTALTPVVHGVNSLHNFPRKPLVRKLGVFSREKATGKVTPVFTFANPSPPPAELNALAPADFAAIYNLNPLYTAKVPVNGNNQTIAIVGDSEICTASSPDFASCAQDDVAAFRNLFKLSNNLPTVVVDGPDPGFNPDEIEGDLDTQWAGAVAPNATILFVIAEDTETSLGIDLAAEHVIDNNLAPVMNVSFGECEAFLGDAGNLFYFLLWEQAAAQGTTVVVSAGDSGSAGCDGAGEFTAVNGVNVNGIASTPFNVAAGGTDFDVTVAGYQNEYWTTNSATDQSAIMYIPETTWNDTCAREGLSACNNVPINIFSPTLYVAAGGGGQSNCVSSETLLNGSVECLGGATSGYPKPSWQEGPEITGTAMTDAVRDLPDISLFASDGFVSGSFYIICEADLNPNGGPCNLSAPYTQFVGVGGTSAAAPTFAGMMALVNQETGTSQGNANYVLYQLASAETYANCNSSTGPAAGCVFNDVTKWNNSVPCIGGLATPSIDCSTQVSNKLGILEPENPINSGTLSSVPAFVAGTGFDLATGLGSVNANNLVTGWPAVVGSFTPTTTTLCLSTTPVPPAPCTAPGPITHGLPMYVNIAVAADPSIPSGDAALIGHFPKGNAAPVDKFTIDPATGAVTNADIYTLNRYLAKYRRQPTG